MNLRSSDDASAQPSRWLIVATGLRRNLSRRRRSAIALSIVVLTATCVDGFKPLNEAPAASAKVDELSEAVAARYTSPERSGRFESARRRLVAGALVPSKAFSDSAIWSAFVPPATRVLSAHGALTDRGFRFEMAPELSPLTHLGDTRHSIALRRLSDNEYRWHTGVDFAIGSITPADMGSILIEVMAGGHEMEPAAVRAAAVRTFPRASATLAKLFTIDSLILRNGGQGTTI